MQQIIITINIIVTRITIARTDSGLLLNHENPYGARRLMKWMTVTSSMRSKKAGSFSKRFLAAMERTVAFMGHVGTMEK